MHLLGTPVSASRATPEAFSVPFTPAALDKVMGIDGAQMDKLWAESKDAGHLVKFGGGFYAGKVEP